LIQSHQGQSGVDFQTTAKKYKLSVPKNDFDEQMDLLNYIILLTSVNVIIHGRLFGYFFFPLPSVKVRLGSETPEIRSHCCTKPDFLRNA
jgi:hypothetical protein